MEIAFAEVAKLTCGVRQVFIRRKDVVGNRGNVVFDLIGDPIGILDDVFFRFFFRKPLFKAF